MRLTFLEIQAIQICSAKFFPKSKVYLFGSRVDNNKKGGDIDLYIETDLTDIFQRKNDFSVQLQQQIGEQKIDILINNGSENKMIFKTAKETGIEIMNKYQYNLEHILLECEKHKIRIVKSSEKMQNFMPLTVDNYQNLNDEQITLTDQFLFRFSKLQDLIGAKLFPTILLFLGEDIKSQTVIDRLNRLEQLELIKSRLEWQELRDLRNNLAHQYEQDSEKSIQFISAFFQKRNELINFYLQINKYCHNQYK
jgi:predicted nucleotidyltransferase